MKEKGKRKNEEKENKKYTMPKIWMDNAAMS